jgi:hypothetical protein
MPNTRDRTNDQPSFQLPFRCANVVIAVKMFFTLTCRQLVSFVIKYNLEPENGVNTFQSQRQIAGVTSDRHSYVEPVERPLASH